MRRLLALAAAVLLAGCSELTLDTSALLSPPSLSAQQVAISEALAQSLGTDSYKLKYPKRGKNLSAYVFCNLDADEEEEALVFYELTMGGASSTWLTVMDRQAGVWRSAFDLAAPGSDIDYIDFAPIQALGENDLVVGWSLPGEQQSLVVVYRYREGRLSKTFEERCSELLLADVNQNNLTELVLFDFFDNGAPYARLAALRAGKLSVTSQVALTPQLVRIAAVRFGLLGEGMPAVFADMLLDANTMTTEILFVDDHVLEVFDGGVEKLYETFSRPAQGLVCRDYDGDGFVEIPVVSPAPGYTLSSENNAMLLTRFRRVVDGAFSTRLTAAVNTQAGYLFAFPELWLGNVTIKALPEYNEWRFYVFNSTLADSTTELLRIKTLSASTYRDRFETENYTLLARKGPTEYYAYLPTIQGGVSLGLEEVKAAFALLP